MAGMSTLLAYQPFKGLYVTFAILLNLAKFPFWLLYFLPQRLRQHPKYTLGQAIKNEIVRAFVRTLSTVRAYTPLVLQPGSSIKNPDEFVIIPPSSKSVYRGVLDEAEIKPATICGTWYGGSFAPANDADKPLVLHFHGGAFVTGDSRPNESGWAGHLLSKYVASKALLVSYRLASNPGGRFPAALQDAVTSYRYLLEAGMPPSKIIISGDSAGGNLAIALLRYIADTSDHEHLPAPGGCLLWSPWVDVASGLDAQKVNSNPRYPSDFLSGGFINWGASSYAPATGPHSVTDPYISPLGHPFGTQTPVWVQTCKCEMLYDDDVKFHSEMQSIQGNKVELYEIEVASHDVLLVGNLTGFSEEAVSAAKVAAKWIASL